MTNPFSLVMCPCWLPPLMTPKTKMYSVSMSKRYISKKTNKISWENVVKSTHFLDSATFLSWHPWPPRGPFPAALPASPRATPGPQRSRDPERLRTADLAVSEMTRELWQNNFWKFWSHFGKADRTSWLGRATFWWWVVWIKMGWFLMNPPLIIWRFPSRT